MFVECLAMWSRN